MSESTGNQLLTTFPAGCTASNLLMKKWMGLIRPKLRLRVRLLQNRDFVSSTVKVHSQSTDNMNFSRVEWFWNDDVKPSFANNEEFVVEIERRFLLRFRCILRTRPYSIDRIRIGDSIRTLSLYEGKQDTEVLEGGIEMGNITFMLQNDVSSEPHSTEANPPLPRHTRNREKVGPHKEYRGRD